jgi:hypothetical protein
MYRASLRGMPDRSLIHAIQMQVAALLARTSNTAMLLPCQIEAERRWVVTHLLAWFTFDLAQVTGIASSCAGVASFTLLKHHNLSRKGIWECAGVFSEANICRQKLYCSQSQGEWTRTLEAQGGRLSCRGIERKWGICLTSN